MTAKQTFTTGDRVICEVIMGVSEKLVVATIAEYRAEYDDGPEGMPYRMTLPGSSAEWWACVEDFQATMPEDLTPDC